MQQRLRFCVLLVLVLGFLLGVKAQANASPLELQTSRIFGQRQIDTAIEVSKSGWERSDTVIIVNCDVFPDALVAVPLSHRLDAPILLNPHLGLDPEVLKEIKRLGATNAIVLGGEAVLKPKVIQDLKAAQLQTRRIYGYDQFETAAKVAEELGSEGQIILANGYQFPDALAISAYAGVTESPILLTGPKEMPEVTRKTLDKLQANVVQPKYDELRVLVIGGEAVISTKSLTGIYGIKRIAGYDQYGTAYNISVFARDELNPEIGYLVTGMQFPDGLVAGAIAAKKQAQIFMAERDNLSGSSYSALSMASDYGLQHVILIGGTFVLTNNVDNMVQGKIPPRYLLAGLTVVIDPGHGGPDVGARGVNNTFEKNNTLPVGLYLAEPLRLAGANVVFTRITDVSPAAQYSSLADLQARVDIANNAKADLFVSIHNDASSNLTAQGTTTYWSSSHPLGSESYNFGNIIQAQLIKSLGSTNRGVRDSQFYVVKNTKMPAVLVELGFISHPQEGLLLGNADYQRKAATAIFKGILVYKGY